MEGVDGFLTAPASRRFLLVLLLGGLAVLCFLVLRPFLGPIAWAVLIAYVTWPAYVRLRRLFGRYRASAAFCMTLIVLGLALVPLSWILILVQQEILDTYRTVSLTISEKSLTLPAWLRDLGPVGLWLQDILDRHATDPGLLGREMIEGLQRYSGDLARLLANAGRNVGKVLVTALTLFFLYRDGDELARQGRVGTRRFFGSRLHRSVVAAGRMAHAVVYGMLVTAILQGLLAGVGYAMAGLAAPALLGVVTGLASTVPVVGTALVWAPLALGLLVNGAFERGVLLLIWGIVLVNPVDNVIRPLLISNMTRVPFLLAMFGALGGLSVFGVIGVFAGPILLAVALGFWMDIVRGPRSVARGH